ncbi:hypothetical protein [Corallococcus sp. M7]
MFKYSKSAVLVGMAVLFSFGGALDAMAAEPAAEGPAFRVTYLVYSGRPNPRLLVTDSAQVRAIQAQLDKVERTPALKGTESHAVLGYSGILIERVGVEDKQEQLIVKGSTLRSGPGEGEGAKSIAPATVRTSPVASDLEAALLELGQSAGVLDANTLRVVRDSRN